MSSVKCVVEGCNLEYDVVCSFSFYNVNTSTEAEQARQEWIEGAMKEESECLWRHVSLQLCGYHFEMDAQGLWIDSPVLPELLTHKEDASTPVEKHPCSKSNKTRPVCPTDSYQGLFEQFIDIRPPDTTNTKDVYGVMEQILSEHNYSVATEKPKPPPVEVSRLNVRQLVDTLGYLSLKSLQRKQLWVAKVETEKSEASITQAEQVITKMSNPKQVIEILPTSSTADAGSASDVSPSLETFQLTDDAGGYLYEIAEEQEITMEEVNEIPQKEWSVNITPEEPKPKYAYIKHCTTGKKKRHFTAELNEVTLNDDCENYYILPDADPSIGVEITTTYEPENYIVQGYEHLVLDERPRKRKEPKNKEGKKKRLSVRDQVKQIKTEIAADWSIDHNLSYDEDDDDKKGNRVRRKNKKYLGYDFVT